MVFDVSTINVCVNGPSTAHIRRQIQSENEEETGKEKQTEFPTAEQNV